MLGGAILPHNEVSKGSASVRIRGDVGVEGMTAVSAVGQVLSARASLIVTRFRSKNRPIGFDVIRFDRVVEQIARRIITSSFTDAWILPVKTFESNQCDIGCVVGPGDH